MFAVPLVHEGEEQADLNGFHFHVAHLVDQQAIVGQIPLEDLLLRMIGHRAEQLRHQLGELDVAARIPALNGLDEETGRQSGLAASSRADPDQVAILGHVI